MIVYQSDQHVLRASVITVDQNTGLLHAGYRGTLQLDDGKAATPAVGLRSGSARTSPSDANPFSVLGGLLGLAETFLGLVGLDTWSIPANGLKVARGALVKAQAAW